MRFARRTLTLLRALAREARADRLTFMAGSVAYHAFVSLLPFMLVVVLLVSRIEDEATAESVLAEMGTYLSPHAGGLVFETVTQATEQTSLSILGGGVLLWGAIKIFRSLDEAFSDIYDAGVSKSIVDSFKDAIVALGAVGLGLAVAAAIGAVLSFGDGPLGTILDRLVATASLAVVFLPLFYLFPDKDVTIREVIPGTVLAALGWTLLEALFRYYVAVVDLGARYGVLGTVLLLVTWLYFSGFVLLLGASVNAILGGRSADVAELGWGEDTTAKVRAPFARPLEALGDALDDRDDVVVETGRATVRLPPPDDVECDVSAPDNPDGIEGDPVRGRLVLQWRKDEEA